ncbi:CinA family protein [Collinsella sp. zg1085]|uniref:CinA family protein n=1 Tax=Collinsella sp. zg1085 TaxID=2844380 RepID=UPI001C0D3DA7|nr:CinA family protein [Collinsella sp. zg1085]QWT16993.1 CinA family protein [Collinsella sp. zg1085]
MCAHTDNETQEQQAQKLVDALVRHSYTISTAESCTAGLIAAGIADVAGASRVLRGGVVSYCDEVKEQILGVESSSLTQYSAVSEVVALEMATRAQQLFATDVAISATGYAGPGGGTELDPVGSVYLGLAMCNHTRVKRYCFSGSRAEVRRAAVQAAFELICEVLS